MFAIFKILIPHTPWTKNLWRFQKFWSRKPLDFVFSIWGPFLGGPPNNDERRFEGRFGDPLLKTAPKYQKRKSSGFRDHNFWNLQRFLVQGLCGIKILKIPNMEFWKRTVLVYTEAAEVLQYTPNAEKTVRYLWSRFFSPRKNRFDILPGPKIFEEVKNFGLGNRWILSLVFGGRF